MFTVTGKQVANVVDEILAEQGMFLCFLLLVVDEIFRNLWIIRNSDMMMIDQMECYAIYIYIFLLTRAIVTFNAPLPACSPHNEISNKSSTCCFGFILSKMHR